MSETKQRDDYFEAEYHGHLILKNDLGSYKTCRIYRGHKLIYSATYTKSAELQVNESIKKITGFQFPKKIELVG